MKIYCTNMNKTNLFSFIHSHVVFLQRNTKEDIKRNVSVLLCTMGVNGVQ